MTPQPETEEFDVAGRPGEPIALPITPGPATGHRWYLDLPDEVHRVEDEAATEPDQRHALGGTLGGRLRVVAPPGEHVITATFARPWELPNAERRVLIRLHVH